jgi:hypothetical protein
MKNILSSVLTLGIISVSLTAQAVGPRSVLSNGTPVLWATMPVDVDLEADLDVRGKDALPLIQDALSQWASVSEADVSFQVRALGASVDSVNECTFLYDPSACPSGPTDDGLNPLVIDEDGEIMSDFFGAGNKFTTLGFASIISFESTNGHAVKGEAVFNASCLSGVEVSGCSPFSFSDDDFTSFIVHEVGHFLGLDHSQVNLAEATDSDDSNDQYITTMFPTFILGNGANFKTPEKDDRVGLAQLYPASGFASATWVLQGTAYEDDGRTELQCVNLVARNVADPLVDAVSALSGDFAPARTANGDFEIPGLTPGATYQLDFVSIGSGFLGASGYTPCRGSSGEASPPRVTEFTASSNYASTAGATLTVHCIDGDDCVIASNESGGSGGCQLMR